MDAFLSYSSKDRAIAAAVKGELEAAGFQVWLDDSEIRLGVLLRKELQESIRAARALVLLWSQHAAESRWVASEWLTALHLDRFIIPCVLDDTPPPQCLQSSVFLDLTDVTPGRLQRLARAVREAPESANALTPVMRSQSKEMAEAIAAIARGQQQVGAHLGKREVAAAADVQALLDGIMEQVLKLWALDPMIVNLAGYHAKNAYMIRHWDAIQAGRGPKDPLLDEAESRFFETLTINPRDPSALNGLGSILIFERELSAAEFFILSAMREAELQNIHYPDAEHDLALLRRYKAR